MLTRITRALTALCAGLYLLLGVALFFFPTQSTPVFPWKVTPFIAMTIGAWCLGNAWLAGVSAARGDLRLTYTACLYLLIFGLSELSVVYAFRDRFALAGWLSWGYLLALAASVAAGVAALFAWLGLPSRSEPVGAAISKSQRLSTGAFVLFVGFLAAYGMLAAPGALGTNGGIFPELMTPFTLRSFAAFYLSLALAVVPFFFERSLPPLLHHSFASYGLIVTITLAALINLSAFDFANRPGGLLYIGAYLAVGIPVGIELFRLGTGAGHTPRATDFHGG